MKQLFWLLVAIIILSMIYQHSGCKTTAKPAFSFKEEVLYIKEGVSIFSPLAYSEICFISTAKR